MRPEDRSRAAVSDPTSRGKCRERKRAKDDGIKSGARINHRPPD
jgi:hypothetical protein